MIRPQLQHMSNGCAAGQYISNAPSYDTIDLTVCTGFGFISIFAYPAEAALFL